MSTEITITGNAYEPKSLEQAFTMAGWLVQSGMLPKTIRTPEAALAIMVAGKELGMTTMQSFRSIHLIDGKVALAADLMVALAKRSEACEYFQLVESTDQIATYETKRRGNPTPTRMSFTMADANRAGLTGRGPWKQYPGAMLRARCASGLVRAEYPDVAIGLYDQDELQERPPSVPPPPMEPRPITNRISASTSLNVEPDEPKAKNSEYLDAAVINAVKDLESAEYGTSASYKYDQVKSDLLLAFTSDDLQAAARKMARFAADLSKEQVEEMKQLGRAKRREIEGK